MKRQKPSSWLWTNKITEYMLSKKEIDALPTILDVVEQFSRMENEALLRNGVTILPGDAFQDEGRYSYVSETWNRNVVRLMPVSATPYTYYRGQSRYYEPCVPSLFRRNENGVLPNEVDVAYNRLKICEFERLLSTHPVFCELSHNISVNPVALAQHYGLTTEYLDITNSKWVAAFFASTRYDYDTDTYHPVGREYGDGYGVMYISKPYEKGDINNEFFVKNVVIGYQYFERPSKQSSFGYKMEADEDFNESPYFERILFRHDLEASKIVFDMSYKQRRFIPKDSLSRLSRQIAECNEVTRWAVELCLQMCYRNKDMAYLESVCAAKGMAIREDNMPVAGFTPEELAADWKEWDELGREDLKSRILSIIPMTTIRLDELK